MSSSNRLDAKLVPKSDQRTCLESALRSIRYVEISDDEVLRTRPLVSVKMATYNHEAYIADSIDGVLQQETNFPVELVIGEDCSTDRTREIVLEYQKRYPEVIRVIAYEHNVGGKRNALLLEAMCRGKYVAFCEGDDFWHHDGKLQMQVDYLETHPDCGLVHSNIDRLQQSTGHLERSVNGSRSVDFNGTANAFEGILLGDYSIATCTVCVRKKLLEEATRSECELLLNPNVKQGDLPRWLYIARKSDLHYIDDSLATYRRLPESASHSTDILHHLAFQESSKEVRKHFAHKHGCREETQRAVDRNYLRVLLRAAFYKNEHELADDVVIRLGALGHKLSIRERVYLLGAHSKGLRKLALILRRLKRFFSIY